MVVLVLVLENVGADECDGVREMGGVDIDVVAGCEVVSQEAGVMMRGKPKRSWCPGLITTEVGRNCTYFGQ